jgi:hypothetical protein
MRLVVAVIAVVLFASRSSSADAVPRFEYAELKLTRTFVGAVGQPAAAPAAKSWTVKLVWSTADEVVEADEWNDLATRLKAPAAKKESTETQHQLRAFNRLGADGWEVYQEATTTAFSPRTTTWSFKRRLP